LFKPKKKSSAALQESARIEGLSLPTAPRWDNRALFHLIWPIIIEQILAVSMGAADTIMVSSVGEFAVSGVNIIDNINNLLIIAFAALSTGGAVVVSQYIGRKDPKNASLAARQLFYVVFAVSLVIMLIALSSRRYIIRLFYGNIEADVMEAAVTYFSITALSFPFMAVYNASAALFRAMGNSRVTMRIALLVNVVKIGIGVIFIYGLKMGVAGAALSTLIGRSLAAFILSFMLIHNKRGQVSLKGLFKIQLVRPTLRSIFNVGIPSGLESSMFQVGRLLTQRIFTGFGTAAMAANAVASVINSFSFMPGMAYGMALLTVVGQCVGAGDYKAAKHYTAKILKLAFLTMFVMNLGIYIFMDSLVSIFNLNPESHQMAKYFLRVHCISMVIGWVFSFALPNALRAAGDARYVMIVATISMWTVRVSAAYLLTFLGVGPISVWLAMGGDFIVRGSCYLFRWRRGSWQNKKVLSD
jgi:putative MATE family efflux protein